ncbi:hypothetical protein KR52_06415 [Synechococcus sp. KORDI-52]|nr:ferredoxin [Synechococcus sp. KORDI-52]AII48774.1 hypothetical protein KR52_06415 [Synechococcus sp. KORDI-52]
MTIHRVSHHLLLCATASKAKCCDPQLGAESWAALKQGIQRLDLENPQRDQGIVLRSKADCLRICSNGPVLLIWPDGCWYGGVTPERIDRILTEHVVGGHPIDDWLIQRSVMALSQAAAS